MRAITLVTAGLASVALSQPAAAQEQVTFDIPASRLDVALVRFARQAGMSVDVSDRALRRVRSSGLGGKFGRREALRRLLRGTGFDFRIDRQGVITLRQRQRPERPSPAPATARQPTAPPAPPPPPPEPIIVTASKQDASLSDYPGSISAARLDLADGLRFGAGGSEVLLRELPNLTSTDLGSGRNKIFVRGVADSSFNGQTQATISQYLGENRLNYSGPDPSLLLYDIEQFEVLEGPQGTLHGAGSLGGVIQITPRAPVSGETSISGVAAISATQDRLGGELALVGNAPLSETAALRMVAYRTHQPGYIDDAQRGLSDINSTDIAGLRANILVEAGDTFDLEFGVVAQDISSNDGQYADSLDDRLARHSAIAQPFDSNYLLAHGTGRASFGFADLVSTTSISQQAIDTVFDATPRGSTAPQAFVEDRNIVLFAHETRLQGSSGPLSSWVAGTSIARNDDRAIRFLGPAADLEQISLVRSMTLDAALFGEATLGPWNAFSLTLGGRYSWVRQEDEVEFDAADAEFEPKLSGSRFLPTAALSWRPREGMIVYARYREGYRPGAIQVIGSDASALVDRFDEDDITTKEAGIRIGQTPGSRFWGNLVFSYSRWDGIQADLVTDDGFPLVANLGDGFVRYISLDLGVRPAEGLSLEASGFMTTSQLDRPAGDFIDLNEEDLPNIADMGGQFSARWEHDLGKARITITGSLSYIGTSFLGIGEPIELPQGDYFDTALGARLELGQWGISLDVENLLDDRANRFSFGNPFFVAEGNQRTPMRPRTVRLGIDARF